jgi:uncharacterized protein
MNDETSDPVLLRLKTDLGRLYGEKLVRVLLYGSRARGDHGADSDYDVLVVLKPPFDRWNEIERLAQISTEIGLDSEIGVVLSLRPATPRDLEERTGFMHNVRREMLQI